jgi:hypothetical protein
MSSQGPAKAPDLRGMEREKQSDSSQHQGQRQSSSVWQVWKQVIIGEILNVMERRRDDNMQLR